MWVPGSFQCVTLLSVATTLLSPDVDGRTSMPLPAFQQSTFVSQGGQVRMKGVSWRTRFPPATAPDGLSLGAALPLAGCIISDTG